MTGIILESGGGEGVIPPTLDNPASAADLLAGKEAIDGENQKLLGTILCQAAATYTPQAAVQTIAAGRYLSGPQTIAAVPSQSKSVTPSRNQQIVLPDPGCWLDQVTVAAMNIPGKRFYYSPLFSFSSAWGFSLSNLNIDPWMLAFVCRDAWDPQENDDSVLAGFALRSWVSDSRCLCSGLLWARGVEQSDGSRTSQFSSSSFTEGITWGYGTVNVSFRSQPTFDTSLDYYLLICGV